VASVTGVCVQVTDVKFVVVDSPRSSEVRPASLPRLCCGQKPWEINTSPCRGAKQCDYRACKSVCQYVSLPVCPRAYLKNPCPNGTISLLHVAYGVAPLVLL